MYSSTRFRMSGSDSSIVTCLLLPSSNFPDKAFANQAERGSRIQRWIFHVRSLQLMDASENSPLRMSLGRKQRYQYEQTDAGVFAGDGGLLQVSRKLDALLLCCRHLGGRSSER